MTQSPARSRPPLSTYDPILGPTLAARIAWPSALDIALAVALRGLDAGIAPGAIYSWLSLRTRTDNRFAAITSSPRRFSSLVITPARAKRAASSRPAGRRAEAVHVARRCLGLLCTPAPTSITDTGQRIVWTLDGRRVPFPRLVDARQALAIVGLALIESILDEGRDTVLVSGAWLAVQMGVDDRKARSALRTCVDLGWVRLVTKRAGSSGRYDLGKRNARWLSQEARTFAYNHPFSVEAFVERTPSADPLAEVITAVAHPAVSYHLRVKPWLAGVSMEAGTPLTHLGLARGVKAAQTAWLNALAPGFTDRPEATLAEALDAHATATGADVRAQGAEAARRRAAEIRRAEAEAHRKAKKALHAWLPDVLAKRPIPKPGDVTAADWARAVTGEIESVGLPDIVRGDLVRSLAKHLVGAGHDADRARVIARRLAGLPGPKPTNQTGEAA